MSQLDDFLRQDVEQYLLGDLDELMREEVRSCFPLLLTACAGIELFGSLLKPRNARRSGDACFRDYWAKCLYAEDAEKAGLGDTVYRLARNGLAHAFLLKGRIAVGRRLGDNHLRRAGVPAILYIDALALAEQVRASYAIHVLPRSRGESGLEVVQTMQANLDELLTRYGREASWHSLAVDHEQPRSVDHAAVSMSTTTWIRPR